MAGQLSKQIFPGITLEVAHSGFEFIRGSAKYELGFGRPKNFLRCYGESETAHLRYCRGEFLRLGVWRRR